MARAPLVVAAIALAAASTVRAEHPLITDDIDSQGKGGWQLELNGERSRDRDGNATITGRQAAAVVSYGVLDNVDLQLGVPWHDNGAHSGIGDVTLDLKWRFYESGPLKIGLKPRISLPSGSDERGLGGGRVAWAATGVAAYQPERFALLGNLEYRHNRNTVGERTDLTRVSGALLPRVTKALRLVLDVAFATNPDPAADGWLREVVVGFIYGVTKDLDFDLGYRRGNEPAIDRAVMAGITLRW